MRRVKTSITLRPDLQKEAMEAVERGAFPGVTSFSGLVEYAIKEVLSRTQNKPK